MVVFDEFYECSLNVDLGLVLIWEIWLVLCDDLLIFVMLVMFDVVLVVVLLDDVLMIIFEGCVFFVDICYCDVLLFKEIWLENVVVDIVLIVFGEMDGGVLVFLLGEGEIWCI